jgi:hypothetical protein
MNDQKFPPGWDAERVRRLIANYDAMDEEQQVALDDLAAAQNPEFLNEIRRIRNEEDLPGTGKDISGILKRWPIE